MKKSIDITPAHLAIVLQILKKNLSQGASVWVFGSRVGRTKKLFSDLDLAIDVGQELPYPILVDLKHDFEESDLPYKVDIVDWYGIDEAFQKRIGVYRNSTLLRF